MEASPAFFMSSYYEDNINSARRGSDKVDDFSLRYHPSLELAAHGPEWSLDSSCKLNIVEYFKETEWNYVDQDYEILGSWDLSRSVVLTGGVMYTVDSDTDEYYLSESDIGGVGGYLVRRYKNKTLSYMSGVSFQLNKRSFLMLTGMWSIFETGSTDESDFYNVVCQYKYLLSPTSVANLQARWNKFSYVFNGEAINDDFFNDVILGDTFDLGFNSDYDMDTYEVSGGVQKDFNAHSIVSCTVGCSYTQNDATLRQNDPETEESLITKDSGSGDGLTFNLSLETEYSDYMFKFEANQNIGNNPNTGASYEQLRLRLRGRRQITERLAVICALRFQRERTDESEEFLQDRETVRYFSDFSLNYTFRRAVFSAGYRVSLNQNKNTHKQTVRNSAYVMFTVKTLRPWVVR